VHFLSSAEGIHYHTEWKVRGRLKRKQGEWGHLFKNPSLPSTVNHFESQIESS